MLWKLSKPRLNSQGGCLLLCCLLTAVSVGCNAEPDRLPLVPVQGKVVYQGKPLANALVVLHPLSSHASANLVSHASTDSSGTFTVSTYDANDGAPVGDYKVTVECYKLLGSNGQLQPGPNFLPPKYSQTQTSTLAISVNELKQEQHVLELK
jgi:hypothetical protein